MTATTTIVSSQLSPSFAKGYSRSVRVCNSHFHSSHYSVTMPDKVTGVQELLWGREEVARVWLEPPSCPLAQCPQSHIPRAVQQVLTASLAEMQ